MEAWDGFPKRPKRSECERRRRYNTLRAAERVAERIKQIGGPLYAAYGCARCKGFHVRPIKKGSV